jgi:hypothetical protein
MVSARTLILDVSYLSVAVAGRHCVADAFSQQRSGQRRTVRNRSPRRIRFIFANYTEGLLAAIIAKDIHRAAKTDMRGVI